MIKNYYLGCPVWGNKEWVGEFFSEDARPKDFIRQYASVMNTVEGNNTFYGLPKAETILRWAEETPPEFSFCFKFPRLISHDKRLIDTAADTNVFLKLMEPLAERLGMLFLQLPPSFGAHGIDVLEKFLSSLPTDYSYSVEVRHLDFFDGGVKEQKFNTLLERLGVNRVMFDTITLHNIKSGQNADVLEAQRKKPKMPPRFIATGTKPFLRFVGHQQVEPNLPRLNMLADKTAGWLLRGLTPYVCLHSPNDFHAPALCRTFHELLKTRVGNLDIGEMPEWPIDRKPPPPKQMTLF